MAATVLLLGAAGSARAETSPGFKPDPGLGSAKPRALPSITIGTGKLPNLIVDAAGTAHIVYTIDGGSTSPDTLAVCNLQRGRASCAQRSAAPTPSAPGGSAGGIYSGNIPSGNHDTDGAVPLAIANQLYVVERRYPDVFPTPDGQTSDSNVFEYSSNDGGVTLTGPADIGDNQMAGGAIVYGDPSAPSIGTISRDETGGTFFQGTAPGTYGGQATAELGGGSAAFDGSVAPDMSGSTIRPVAAYDGETGHVYIREWSGQGDINDVSTWLPPTAVPGYSPQIVGGASGVYLLTSSSDINDGTETLRKIVNGAVSGAATKLEKSLTPPAISEDAAGEISYAYTDANGVEATSSSDGRDFAPSQLAAAIPDGNGVGHLVTAAAADGGGFVSFVKNGTGAEDVGTVVAAAYGSQLDTGAPGLGPLPGGGIGSAAGDQLATSNCFSAKFGDVDAEVYQGAACFTPNQADRNMSDSVGIVDLNGLLLIPDKGVTIGIDPKLHKIQTTGPVRVVLRANGIPDITLYHGPLNIDVPDDGDGADLFSPYFDGANVDVAGFPVSGSIDVKLVKGGVNIPISLKLPGYLGGITGSVILHATSQHGLSIDSLNFMVQELNLGALELKDLKIKYQRDGDVWDGSGELQVPAGGDALDLHLTVEFVDGQWTQGHVEVGLDYPGFPLAADPPPPQLYFDQAGLDLDFRGGTSLTGTASFGAIPFGDPGPRGYLVSADVSLKADFRNPVTLTLTGDTYLTSLSIGHEVLTWQLPDSFYFTGHAGISLGPVDVSGDIAAQIDPHHHLYGASLQAKGSIFGITLEKLGVAINQKGFGADFDGGGVVYHWGDAFPKPIFHGDCTTRFMNATNAPQAAARNAHAVASNAFIVPRGAPSADVVALGAGASPNVVLVAPNGQQVVPTPLAGRPFDAVKANAESLSDPGSHTTDVGLDHPQAGTWQVLAAPGSPAAIASIQYALGEPSPSARATLSGSGHTRVLHYHVAKPKNTAVTFVEKTNHLMHVIGTAKRASGAIPFAPVTGPAGRREVVAEITDNGLPLKNVTLTTYRAPGPLKPGRARDLRVRVTHGGFTYGYKPPANASRVLVKLTTSDGRHLERAVSTKVRSGSLAALGPKDAVTITVTGLAADGSHGPSVRAQARRALSSARPKPKPTRTKRRR